MAVASRTAVDVSLKLFDVLGLIAMTGLMLKGMGDRQQEETAEAITAEVARLLDIGLSMIESNGALRLPICDDQGTDIALFLLLCLWGGPIDGHRVMRWLQEMVERYEFCVRYNGRYPTSFTEYTDLIEHPRQRTQEYFEEATAGSTLVPLLAGWTSALGRPDLATVLARLATDKLKHCTMQVWTPAPIPRSISILTRTSTGGPSAICRSGTTELICWRRSRRPARARAVSRSCRPRAPASGPSY